MHHYSARSETCVRDHVENLNCYLRCWARLMENMSWVLRQWDTQGGVLQYAGVAGVSAVLICICHDISVLFSTDLCLNSSDLIKGLLLGPMYSSRLLSVFQWNECVQCWGVLRWCMWPAVTTQRNIKVPLCSELGSRYYCIAGWNKTKTKTVSTLELSTKFRGSFHNIWRRLLSWPSPWWKHHRIPISSGLIL